MARADIGTSSPRARYRRAVPPGREAMPFSLLCGIPVRTAPTATCIRAFPAVLGIRADREPLRLCVRCGSVTWAPPHAALRNCVPYGSAFPAVLGNPTVPAVLRLRTALRSTLRLCVPYGLLPHNPQDSSRSQSPCGSTQSPMWLCVRPLDPCGLRFRPFSESVRPEIPAVLRVRVAL